MSDPLSVAGTAVGITSLGIQVCQGLIQYLRAVRGRKQELRDGIREIEQVVSLLYSLNGLLPKISTGTDVAALRSCLNNCYAKLETLQEVLGELDDTKHSSQVTSRAANAMRSITYPFQQEKLTAIRQSLRSVLDDLNLMISIISLDAKATIQRTISTISLDLKAHTSSHASDISDLQIQIDSNFVQLRSLQNTIADTLNDIAEQLHQTQLYIQDLDQRVDGKLTIIESGTQSIQDSNQVTAAKLEELTHMLVSNTTLIKTMALHINGIRSLPNAGSVTAKHANPKEYSRRALYMQPTKKGRWEGCNCASSLPKSRISFRIWSIEFELEQQEHHQPACKLWGIRKGMQRTAKATFPLKLAWLSTRMTVACFEYTSGTNRPSLSVRCLNMVQSMNSPVSKLLYHFEVVTTNRVTAEKLARDIELLERDVLTLYMDGKASPGDIDETGQTHAEAVFGLVNGPSTNFMGDIVQSDAVAHAFISCIRTLLQAENGDNNYLSFSRALAGHLVAPDPFQLESINTRYLLTFLSQQGCFRFSPWVVVCTSAVDPSRTLKEIIQEDSELPPIHQAILCRDLESLRSSVTQSSKSVNEKVFGINVLYLSALWPEGLEYLLTTEAKTLIDLPSNDGADCEQTPIMRAIKYNQSQSADALLRAGCCLNIDMFDWEEDFPSSYQMTVTIATHMAARRTRLLEIAQRHLGLFLEHISVTFADSVAAEICATLDASRIRVHPSLRVDPGYKSIYCQGSIPWSAFYLLWETGFNHFKCHDAVGFTPIMRKQNRWRTLTYRSRNTTLAGTLDWLIEKGFMEEKATDPLKLGLNEFATGYHYLGALFAGYAAGRSYGSQFISEIRRILIGPRMSQASKDCCKCWCNAEGHGCSPTKLFLSTYLHECLKQGPERRLSQHLILHHELFDNVSGSDKLSNWIKETLRWLTFEALEMTHTCCSFEGFNDHDPCGLANEKAEGDKGVFCQDPTSVLTTRSCAIEQSSATILEELVAEFTERLQSVTAGSLGFVRFLYTYWRRRISGLYTPSSNALKGLRQHEAFKGVGISNTVRTGVLPETLKHLLGEDFLLTKLDGPISLEDCAFEVKGYEELYCRMCDPDD